MTLVFTDVQGSTSQWEKDPLTMATALRLHNVIIRRNLRKYGGYEVKTEGGQKCHQITSFLFFS